MQRFNHTVSKNLSFCYQITVLLTSQTPSIYSAGYNNRSTQALNRKGEVMRTFVYNQLSQTYGPEAESIIKSLDRKLSDMEEHTTDSFQILLQTIVYPFIFTVDILKSAGKSEVEAIQFVRTAWDRFMSSSH